MKRTWAMLPISVSLLWVTVLSLVAAEPAALQVGTSAVNLKADDAMVIAGGIGPGKAQGQEGELRATAVVLAEGANESGDRQLRCADADPRSAGPGRRRD